MEISQLIHEALFSKSPRIFNENGLLVDARIIRQEFSDISKYLNLNFSLGDRILIDRPADVTYLLTILACMNLGIVYVPIMTSWPQEKKSRIYEMAGAKGVFKELPQSFSNNQSPSFTLNRIPDELPLYIVTTSGSTGLPKGVEISRQALISHAQDFSEYIHHIGPSDKILLTSDFSFDASLTSVIIFLLKGTEFHFSNNPSSCMDVAYEIEQKGITTLLAVPNLIKLLLSDSVFPRFDLKSLKNLFIGGSTFDGHLYKKCSDLLLSRARIFNVYGPSETTIWTHVYELKNRPEQEISKGVVTIGKGLSKIKTLLKSPSGGTIQTPFESGELWLGGPQVMMGYIQDSKTPSSPQPIVIESGTRYFRSGDEAFFDSDGNYFILGRLNDTIKRRGIRINLGAIDHYIQKIPEVELSATVYFLNENSDATVVSYIKTKNDLSAEEIQKRLLQVAAQYEAPDHIEFVDHLPLNTAGKVDRVSLMNLAKRRFSGKDN